jgi:hypothetical protein
VSAHTAAKRRLLQGLVVVLALWPAVQFTLTRTHDVNPWKLFGWAMYSVPGPRLELRVIGLLADGRATLIPRQAYGGDERREAARFFNYSAELGDLASSDALAQAVLAARPQLDAVVIGVLRYRIDPQTARIVSQARYRRHTRDGRSEPFDPPAA